MDVRALDWGGMDWIDVVQDRDRDQLRTLVNTVMNIQFWEVFQ
jgi:hypothetical protein